MCSIATVDLYLISLFLQVPSWPLTTWGLCTGELVTFQARARGTCRAVTWTGTRSGHAEGYWRLRLILTGHCIINDLYKKKSKYGKSWLLKYIFERTSRCSKLMIMRQLTPFCPTIYTQWEEGTTDCHLAIEKSLGMLANDNVLGKL